MINSVIFDMDGLLIDSEPLWKEAEKKAFKMVGVILDSKQVTQTTGLLVGEVVEYWYNRYPWDLSIYNKEKLSQLIVEDVKILIKTKGEAKRGVLEILEFLVKKVEYISIASSSEYSIINVVIDKLGIRKYLSVIYSAEDEEYGKPHPGVYINACKKIGISQDNTLAFEDSLNGVLSAKSAKIKCIAIPEQINKSNKNFFISDMILNSLEDFKEEQWRLINN